MPPRAKPRHDSDYMLARQGSSSSRQSSASSTVSNATSRFKPRPQPIVYRNPMVVGQNKFYDANVVTPRHRGLLHRFGLTGDLSKNAAVLGRYDKARVGTPEYRARTLAVAVGTGRYGTQQRGQRRNAARSAFEERRRREAARNALRSHTVTLSRGSSATLSRGSSATLSRSGSSAGSEAGAAAMAAARKVAAAKQEARERERAWKRKEQAWRRERATRQRKMVQKYRRKSAARARVTERERLELLFEAVKRGDGSSAKRRALKKAVDGLWTFADGVTSVVLKKRVVLVLQEALDAHGAEYLAEKLNARTGMLSKNWFASEAGARAAKKAAEVLTGVGTFVCAPLQKLFDGVPLQNPFDGVPGMGAVGVAVAAAGKLTATSLTAVVVWMIAKHVANKTYLLTEKAYVKFVSSLIARVDAERRRLGARPLKPGMSAVVWLLQLSERVPTCLRAMFVALGLRMWVNTFLLANLSYDIDYARAAEVILKHAKAVGDFLVGEQPDMRPVVVALVDAVPDTLLDSVTEVAKKRYADLMKMTNAR